MTTERPIAHRRRPPSRRPLLVAIACAVTVAGLLGFDVAVVAAVLP